MKVIVVITSFSDQDPLKICQTNDTTYKKSSRYVGRFTNEIETRWKAEGFKRMATQSGEEKVTFFFCKEKTKRKIENFLAVNGLKASITVEIEQEKIAETEALLRHLKVPKTAVSIQ